jgi:hypothetical protein
MMYDQINDSYQPALFFKHVDYRTHPDEIYRVLSKMDFGSIQNIYIRKPAHGNTLTTAVVRFHHWNTRITVNTRDMLKSGKFLKIYYTNDYYWKVYAFNPRHRSSYVHNGEPRDTPEKIGEQEQQTMLKEILEFVERKAMEPTTPEGTPPSSPRTLAETSCMTEGNSPHVVIGDSIQKIKIQKRKA